jgi:hypothetical protein
MGPAAGLLPLFHCEVFAIWWGLGGQETREMVGSEGEGLAELWEVLLVSRHSRQL